MYSTLAFAASLTLGQAFLIPPSISTADSDIINSLPFEHAAEAESRMLDLNCHGCPVLAADLSGHPQILQMENKLRLNFSVAHDENIDRLYLNGLAIHPMDVMDFHSLTAPQLVRIGSQPSVAGTPQLGFHLSIGQPIPSTESDQLHLYELELEIVEVADRFVGGLDVVNLKFLKTPSGKLMISDLKAFPPKPSIPIPAPHDADKECTSVLCKWRAIIAGKLSQLKGCGHKLRPGHKKGHKGAHKGEHKEPHKADHKPGHKVRPHHGEHEEHRPHHGPRPHGSRPHGGHHPHHGHHHKHGAILRLMRSVMLHVMIPITIGVLAGVTASLVGMVVGHLVVFVWRTLFRRGSKQRQSSKLQYEEAHDNEEAKALVDHQGAPPVYEDAPAYEDAVEIVEVVNEEKSAQ